VGRYSLVGGDAVADLIRQLAWHGIATEPHIITPKSCSTVAALLTAARNHDADLLVRGGYGLWRSSELLFGGCTQTVLESGAELPVFLAH